MKNDNDIIIINYTFGEEFFYNLNIGGCILNKQFANRVKTLSLVEILWGRRCVIQIRGKK